MVIVVASAPIDCHAYSAPDERIAGVVIDSAAAGFVSELIASTDVFEMVERCRRIPESMHGDCILH